LLHEQFQRAFGAPPEEHSAERHAERLQSPVLVLHDYDDDIAPVTHAQDLARQLQQATLHLTRKLNHSGALADEDSIGTVVNFVGRHCPASADARPG
jgi:pimeloyl-ACP methyl ester carboxylesterase